MLKAEVKAAFLAAAKSRPTPTPGPVAVIRVDRGSRLEVFEPTIVIGDECEITSHRGRAIAAVFGTNSKVFASGGAAFAVAVGRGAAATAEGGGSFAVSFGPDSKATALGGSATAAAVSYDAPALATARGGGARVFCVGAASGNVTGGDAHSTKHSEVPEEVWSALASHIPTEAWDEAFKTTSSK